MPNNRIFFRQALALSFVIQVVYLPISIYINVEPAYIFRTIGFFVFPAIVGFIYHAIFIVVADRIVEWAESISGGRFLVESPIPAIMLSIPGAVLATLCSNYLFRLVLKLMNWTLSHIDTGVSSVDIQHHSPQMSRVNSGVTFMVMLSISYLIINRRATRKNKDLELKSQRLVNENTTAQFEALKSQISPHFLFNSLSILASLIHKNVDLAEQFITKLSRSYRYILEHKDNNLIPLTTELEFIKSYSFLLKMRFEDKMQLQINILPDVALRYRVAPLTLQLLIENVIKHNKLSDKTPLVVVVAIQDHYLIVENEIHPRDTNDVAESTHVGLKNIENRYRLLTSRPVQVQVENDKFKVKIPLIS